MVRMEKEAPGPRRDVFLGAGRGEGGSSCIETVALLEATFPGSMKLSSCCCAAHHSSANKLIIFDRHTSVWIGGASTDQAALCMSCFCATIDAPGSGLGDPFRFEENQLDHHRPPVAGLLASCLLPILHSAYIVHTITVQGIPNEPLTQSYIPPDR